MLRAVLFDWDDTLSYSTPHYLEMMTAVLTSHDIKRSRAQITRAWAVASREFGPAFPARLHAILGREDCPELRAAIDRAMQARLPVRRRHLFEDVSGGLRYLHGLGLRVGVISDNFEAGALVEGYGLAPLLDLVITPLQAGAMKPAAAIFRTALAVLGLEPAEALYVGDAYDVDVAGARAIGLDYLLIDRWDLRDDVDCPRVTNLDGVLRYVAERRYGFAVNETG